MLSENYKHLYFPINWNNANSRSVAYLINRNHDRLLSQLSDYGFEGRLVELTHTRLSGNKFTVAAKVMSKTQWVLFLLVVKNIKQHKILKQLQKGISLEDVIID